MSLKNKTVAKISFWLSLLLFGLAFVLIGRYTFQLDLTRNQRNTLSPATIEMMRELKDTVIINYYVSSTLKDISRFPADINNFLEVYQGASPHLIYREYGEESLSVPLSEIGLEAHQSTIQRDGTAQRITYYSGIELIYGGKRALIPYIEQTEDLEYTLTTAIDRIIHPFPAEIGIVFAEPMDSLAEGYGNLGAMLAGYNLREIEINASLNFSQTPLLILVGSSLLSAGQVEILKEYLADGGALLVTTGGTNLDVLQVGGDVISLANSPLMTWLSSVGVRVNADLVVDPLSATTINAGEQIIPYPAIMTLSGNNLGKDNPLTKGLSRLVLGWMSSLSLETLDSVKAQILAMTSPQGLSLTSGINAEPAYVLKWLEESLRNVENVKGEPLPLGVALEINGNLNSSEQRRMVVLSGRYAFHDALLPFGGQNLDLLVRSVDWLLQRDNLAGIKKERLVNTWNLTASERVEAHERILLITAFVLPLLLVGAGITVRIGRSRKSKDGQE